MRVGTKKAAKMIEGFGFNLIYMNSFDILRRTEEGCDQIYLNPEHGTMIYLASENEHIAEAKLIMEVEKNDSFTKCDFDKCQVFDNQNVLHVTYDFLTILKSKNQKKCADAYAKIIQDLETHKNWAVMPEDMFLRFVYYANDSLENVMVQVDYANNILKQNLGITTE